MSRINLGMGLAMAIGMGIWTALTGLRGWEDTLIGLAVVYGGWRVYHRLSELPNAIPPERALRWARGVGAYLFFYVLPEMVRSTARVFLKVLRRHIEVHPAILTIRLPGASRSGLILLAYGISLTPGEQIIDVDEGARTLYVHVMDAPDVEATRSRILGTYARYIKEATE